MSPLQFGWPLALLGFVGLVGLLYWLQHLRVRHRDVVVPTTQFWQAAVRDTRARVFRERFRHPLAFAAIVALAGCLWWAASGLTPRDDAEGARTVVLVDASRDLLDPRDWTQAKADVVTQVGQFAGASPEVVVWAGRTHTVLARGEPHALLAPRLEQITPVKAASRIDVLVGDRQAVDTNARHHVFTAQPGLLDQASIEVVRLTPEHSPQVHVVGLGFADDANGTWDRVDVSAEAASSSEPDLWQFALGGGTLALPVDVALVSAGRWRATIRGVPARGERIELTVGAGAQRATAALQLPDRSPIRVALDDNLPQALRLALAADPGLTRDGEPEVAIGAAASPLPRVVLVADGPEVPAFSIHTPHAEGPDATRILAEFVEETAMDRIDATALASARGRAIDVELFPSEVRRIEVVASLVGGSFNLRDSRAFPVFLSRAVRWLAARTRVPQAAEAGTVVEGTWLTQGGRVPLASGATLDVLPGAVPPARDLPASSGISTHAAVGWDLPTWLAVLALLGLSAEWWFVRRGRMP